MSETTSHKRAKARAAGKQGKTEVPLKGGRRLDAASPRTATEVERSGNRRSLDAAARRLKASGKPRKVLQVPQPNMSKASQAMKGQRVKGTVKNMGGTKRRSI